MMGSPAATQEGKHRAGPGGGGPPRPESGQGSPGESLTRPLRKWFNRIEEEISGCGSWSNPMIPDITREQLDGYLEDALSDSETAQVEQALRDSEPLRRRLRALMQERDRGEHSIGAIWRRQHLSFPT